jgi:hypothetical protein
VGVDPHPRATELAEDYDVAHEEIMTWFCDGGYGFGGIMLALKTSEETGVPAGELLARKGELGGWGEVWQELGLIGKPTEVPVGQSKDKPGGPGKDKPGGPGKDKPGGPGKDKPGGPGKDKPGGPGKDKPGGKP